VSKKNVAKQKFKNKSFSGYQRPRKAAEYAAKASGTEYYEKKTSNLLVSV
jgi:hypothetical protein